MKKLIKLAAVIAAMGLALSFVACDDDDDDDDDDTTVSSSSETDEDSEEESEWSLDAMLELAGISEWTALDVDDDDCFWYGDDDDDDGVPDSFSFWSSSIFSTSEVQALSGIAIVYSVSSDNTSGNWVSIYSDNSWQYEVDAGEQSTAGYYALVVTDDGTTVTGWTDSWASSWSVSDVSELSDIISDGYIYASGGLVTVLGAYYE